MPDDDLPAAVPGDWFYEPNTGSVMRHTGDGQGIYEHAPGDRLAAAMNACERLADPSAVSDLLEACRRALDYIADDVAERAAAGKALVVWSLGVLPLDEAPGDDPLDKGPLDHGRSSDVNEEPAS